VSVPPGSPAHAARRAFPTPLLGLEARHPFNASRQMDKWALHSALSQARARMGEARVHSISHTRPHAQVDAVLGSIAAGVAFDSKTAMGAGRGSCRCCCFLAVVGVEGRKHCRKGAWGLAATQPPRRWSQSVPQLTCTVYLTQQHALGRDLCRMQPQGTAAVAA